jgi:triacylglycerol esterase/lipase EstA (alpha/beta hydrolase family)
MTEILLKVALNSIAITLTPNHVTLYGDFFSLFSVTKQTIRIFTRKKQIKLKTENKGKLITLSNAVTQINSIMLNQGITSFIISWLSRL